MKWVAIAALITVFLAVGSGVLAHFIRSADASPKLLLDQERRQRDRDYRFNKPDQELTVRWTPNQDAVEKGRFLYTINCMTCHGFNGDGSPVTPEGLPINPRDFTGKSHINQKVMFKYKSLNKTDALALDEDLKKTIKEGLPGTPMPGFSILSDDDLNSLLEYIKTFAYEVWRYRQPAGPVHQVPPVPEDLMSQVRIDGGRTLFTSRGCVACHGNIEEGAKPPVALPTEWKDESGNTISVLPRNFAVDPIRRPMPADIFTTIRLGIGGTVMPANPVSDEETWNLIAYVLHLRQLGVDGKIPSQ